MARDEAGGEQANGVELFDGGLVAFLAQGGDLVRHFGNVLEHRQIEFGG